MRHSPHAHGRYLFGAMVFYRSKRLRPWSWYLQNRFCDLPASQRRHRVPPGCRDHFRSRRYLPPWQLQSSKLLRSFGLPSVGFLFLLRRAHHNVAPIRAWNRAANKNNVFFRAHLGDPQVLDCHSIVTHVTGHPHIFPNTAWSRTISDGSVPAMRLRSVSGWLAGEPVLFHDTLKALAL